MSCSDRRRPMIAGMGMGMGMVVIGQSRLEAC